MLKANSAAIALATVLSAILSSSVEGHCYHRCYYPNYGAGGFYCSGYGCGGWAGGGCGYGYGYGSGYGCGTLGNTGCGYGAAGYSALKTGHCWHLGKHLHSCCLRRQALCYGNTGGWTVGGCGSGNCGAGNCNTCNVEGTTTQPTGGVIYDGPAAGSTINEGPASEKVKTSQPDSVRNDSRERFQLVSDAQQDGSAAFKKGLASFRSRSFTEAVGSFETASAAEPNNAMYQYYLALALYDLHGTEVASDALKRAVALEQREPIEHWGKRMERIQGRPRAWIESARRDAGLVR